MIKLVSTLAFTALLTACTTPGAINSMVTDAAAFDLDCPRYAIKVKELNSKSYGVYGCEKKARYIAHGCNLGGSLNNCTVIGDGPIQQQ